MSDVVHVVHDNYVLFRPCRVHEPVELRDTFRQTEPARRRVGCVKVATIAERFITEPVAIVGAGCENSALITDALVCVIIVALGTGLEKVPERALGLSAEPRVTDGACVEKLDATTLAETPAPIPTATTGCENTAETAPTATRKSRFTLGVCFEKVAESVEGVTCESGVLTFATGSENTAESAEAEIVLPTFWEAEGSENTVDNALGE